MSALGKEQQAGKAKPAPTPPEHFDPRTEFAARFLRGEGLEIGGLHWPLPAPAGARVRYVDRKTVEQLREEYPELADQDLTPVDIVDDGEALATIPAVSQDFIIANHFLEHCEDPIGTIAVHLSKLKPGGILFYAVPDKRYTFDFLRPVTPVKHMARDHDEGASYSRSGHYLEWTRLVGEAESSLPDASAAEYDEWAIDTARGLEDANFSIHFHVWTQAEFLQLILHCRDRFDAAFDVEAAARRSLEFIVVLRKAGVPEPAEVAVEPTAETQESGAEPDGASVGRRLRASLRSALPRKR